MPRFPPSASPVTPGLADAVRALRTAPGQYAYVGDVVFNLADADADANSDAMAILQPMIAVGFYRLDDAPTTIVGRRSAPPASACARS